MNDNNKSWTMLCFSMIKEQECKHPCMLQFYIDAQIYSHTNLKSVWHTCQSQQQRSNLQWFLFSHILSGQFCIPELNNVDVTFGSGRVILGRGQDKTRHQASRSFESENGHKTHSRVLEGKLGGIYFTLLIRLSWHRWLKKSVLLLILRVSSLF